MPGTPRRLVSFRARFLREDDGFGLIEVLVSAVLVVALAVATLSLLDRTNQASASNRDRAVAANIAHSALNTMRSMTFDNLQDYSNTSTVTQGAIPYTVVSQAVWTTDSNTTLNCSSTGAYSPYLRVTSTVTWPNMNGIKPVTSTSLVSPRASDVATGAGSLVVTVQNAQGQPVPGTNVTAQGQTLVSDVDGCVIFHFLQAGVTTVTWSKNGYITPQGQDVGSQDVSIINNSIASLTPIIDIPGSITTTFKQDVTGTPPASAWLSGTATTAGTFYQTIWAKGSANAIDVNNQSGPGFTNSKLFPTTSGYGVFAGSCQGNDPSVYVKDFGTTHPLAFATPAAGGTATATAYLKPVTFNVLSSTNNGNYRVRIKPYFNATDTQMDDCGTNLVASYAGKLNGSGDATATFDMPYGWWTVCVDNTSNRNAVMSKFAVIPGGTPRTGMPADQSTTAQSFTLGGSTQCSF
jgi:Tfp pilus assembly protein PilV